MGNTHINSALMGSLLGAGWGDNVIHAIAAIAELNPPPGTINMLGWSRGAVTCTKMAFRLSEIFPQMDVNIFAVDPVAGPGNKSEEDASTIRGNVKNYLAVLSMDETRGFFKPQDIKRMDFTNRGTNVIYLPFPGNHSGQVNLDKSVKKHLGEAPEMVWFLARKFLEFFGTRFTSAPSPLYDCKEQCNLYAKMQIKKPQYKKSRPSLLLGGPLGGVKTRDFLKNRIDQYVEYSDFFINEHHRRIFERTFPPLYRWVFENQGTDSATVGRDFKSTENLLALRQTLIDIGFQPAQMGVTPTALVPVRGSGHQAVGALRQQITASMSAMGLYV